MSLTAAEIQKFLRRHASARCREFNRNIITTAKTLLGVPTPRLRELSALILRDRETLADFLRRQNFAAHEDLLLYGLVIGGLPRDYLPFAQIAALIRLYIDQTDNWGACDLLVSALKKLAAREPDALFKIVRAAAKSRQIFARRFALVMLLAHFLDDTHLDFALMNFCARVSDSREIKMAAAWGIATAFPHYRDRVIALFAQQKIEPETRKFAIQKIVDSRRVSIDDKILIKQFRENRRGFRQQDGGDT